MPFWPRRNRRTRPEESETAAKHVTVGDREIPDEKISEWTALDHTTATAPIDRTAVIDEVTSWVATAVAHGSLDDLTADAFDPRIDEMLAQWNARVDPESNQRRAVLHRFQGIQMELLAEAQGHVQAGRRDLARHEAAAAAWRRVLRGAPFFEPGADAVDPTGVPRAPQPVDLRAPLAHMSLLLAEDGLDLSELNLLHSTLDPTPAIEEPR